MNSSASATVRDGPNPTSESRDGVWELFRALWQHKWVVLGVAALVTGATVFWTLQRPKLYQATCRIEYDPNPPRPLGSDIEEVSNPTVNFWSAHEFYETQNRIIASRTIAELVTRKLSLNHNASFMGIPEDERAGWRGVSVVEAAEVLQSRLAVEPVKDTRIVNIVVHDRDPERATLLANSVADTYIEKTMEDRLGSSVSALEWLSTQLDSLKGELEESELALHTFKEANNVLSVSLEDRQNLVSGDIQRFNEALSNALIRRLELSARLARLRAANIENPMQVDAALITQSPTLALLRNQYGEKRAHLDSLSTRYGDSHPARQSTEAELASIRSQMQSEISALIQGAEDDLREIRNTETGLRGALEDSNQAGLDLNLREIEYGRLARERENKAKLYEIVMSRTAETDLTRMIRISNIRVVDRAIVERDPVSPRVPLNVTAGAALGLMLGMIIALAAVRTDRRLKGAEDAEALGVTVLGMLPTIQADGSTGRLPRYGRRSRGKKPTSVDADLPLNRDLIVHTHPMSAAAESCRTVRTNLTFMAAENHLDTLVITSATPREGKTTVATNLAVAIAQSGKQVLLVDTDLRRPRIHRTFNVPAQVGISSVLVGQVELEDAIRSTNVQGLSILPCGPIPPNPSELLHTPRFAAVVAAARERFDMVIFDSPPLGPVTDAAVIAPQVAGVLIVIKAGRTTRDALRSALRQLNDVAAHVTGAVLNGIDPSRGRFRYGYGYGYGAYYYTGGRYYADRDPDEGQDGADPPSKSNGHDQPRADAE